MLLCSYLCWQTLKEKPIFLDENLGPTGWVGHALGHGVTQPTNLLVDDSISLLVWLHVLVRVLPDPHNPQPHIRMPQGWVLAML